jgi:hypothetical protein
METEIIWINIILPILIGPFFVFIKMTYDQHIMKINDMKLKKYNELKTSIKQKLDIFYWPIYLKLLCIYQLNYLIPELKDLCGNYSATSLNIDDNISDDMYVSMMYFNDIQSCGNNYLDKYTNSKIDSEILKIKQNQYCVECKNIIEKYIYICCPNNKLGVELINFVNHINISVIVNEKGVIYHNMNNLLSLIERDLYNNQEIYNNLINNGPYKST